MTHAERWCITETANFIVRNAYRIVALQFPDEYLEECVSVVEALEKHLIELDHDAKLCVLADSAYDQLTVDAIAAAHVNADCLVHYGNASLTETSAIPTHFVFPSFSFSMHKLLELLSKQHAAKEANKIKCVAFLDSSLHKQNDELKEITLSSEVNLTIADLGVTFNSSEVSKEDQDRQCCCGFSWSFTPDSSFLWIGPLHSELLTQLQLQLATYPWMMFDTESNALQEGLLPSVKTILKRRGFLVEKAKEAQIIGILISSISNKTTLTTLKQIKRLANEAGKTTYEIVVAQPSPSKLANFREIDVFIYLCDPIAMILDSKEFLAPLLTPYEAQLAFTGGYLDYQEYRYHLQISPHDNDDREKTTEDGLSSVDVQGKDLIVRQDMKLAAIDSRGVIDASYYFQKKREFHGLEEQTTLEPSEITKGRSGTASGYDDEI